MGGGAMMCPEEIICPQCDGGVFRILFSDPDSVTVYCVMCESYYDISVNNGMVDLIELEE